MVIAIRASRAEILLHPVFEKMSTSRLNQILVWIVIAAGTAVLVFSGAHLTFAQLDVRLLLLALATVLIGPRLSIQIPRVKAHISVSDTFVFLSLLLFGGEAAVVLATTEALCSSVRISNKGQTHLFNAAVMTCATFLTVWPFRICFGETLTWRDVYSSNYVVALCAMAVIQYAVNSILVATSSALKEDQPVWLTWRRNFLWTSITYFAGASAAGVIARVI